MWLLIISHSSVNFDSHRSRENEFTTIFICYMTLCDQVSNSLCDFVDNKPTFFYQARDHLITWSKRQKTWWMMVLYHKSLRFQVWQSQPLGRWRFFIYRFLFVAWLHVATWLQGHVTFLVVVPQLKSPVCQVWWP